MKKIMTFLMLFIFSFSFISIVNAKEKVELNVSKDEVDLGEDIELSINIDEETSIYACTAKLTYDKDVFEMLDTQDFKEQENWSSITYNAKNNKFALINKKGISGEKLLQIKLKVKEDAKPGKTAITINSIKTSDGNKEISLDGSTAEVMILKNGLDKDESIPTNDIQEATEENIFVQVKQDCPWLVYVLIAIIIIDIIFLVRFKKKEKNVTIVAIVVLIIALIFAIILLFTTKADVNQDGKIDYEDSKDIMEYLLDIKNDEDISNKDVDNDGKITITDVAIATDKATNNNKYTVNIAEPSESESSTNTPHKEEDNKNYAVAITKSSISTNTPSKNEELTLDLHMEVNPKTDVEFVEIEGKSYKVEKVGENLYRIKVKALSQAGLQNIDISNVILDNGRKIKSNLKITVDVLKDKPVVENFLVDVKKETPDISFVLKDEDNSFKTGKIIVTDEAGNIVLEESIKVGENKFTKGLEEGKRYSIKIITDYDLDSNYFDEENGGSSQTQETIVDKNLTFNRDYNFIGKNITITEKVTSADKLIISFENDYDSYYPVETVKINGKTYTVSKKGNTYQVELEKDKKGKNTVTLEEVTLSNGAKYEVNKKLTYIYMKQIPGINSVNAKLEDDTVNVDFDITDIDESVTTITLYLKNSRGEVVGEKEVDLQERTSSFDIEFAGTYSVELVVKYDLGDGIKQEVKSICSDIKTPIKSSITNSKTLNYYVAKGEETEVTYTIKDNTTEDVVSLELNGVTLPVTKQKDGSYKVKYKAPTKSGELTLTVTKINYKEETINTSYESKVEVLKSAPTITHLLVDDSQDKPVLSFGIQDEENTFIRGKVIIVDENNKTQDIEFNKDTTSIKLENIAQHIIYDVKIEVTYDLDMDRDNNQNQKTDVLKEHNFEIVKDYDFKLDNLVVKEVNREGHIIVLQFESTNISRYVIEEVLINGEEYPVTKNGTIYTVEVPITNTKRTTLTLEEAVLNNLKDFENLNKSVVVFKNAPIVTEIEANVSNDKNAITSRFEVTDEDDTLIKLYAQLKDKNGKVIETKELDKTAREVTFQTSDNNVYQAGEYTVDILADYNALDGLKHEKETLASKGNITVDIVSNILGDIISSYYVEKGQKIEIVFTVEDNTDLDVTDIIMEGEPYSVEKQADGTYKMEYTALEVSGKEILEVTEIKYGAKAIEEYYDIEIEVLKSAPSITHIMVDDTHDIPVLSFGLQDEEDAFVSGKVIIIDENSQKQEIEFSKNETSIELENIAQHTIYDVQIEVTYDLDTDRSNNQNQKTEVLKEHNFEVLKDYDFTLNNLVVKEVNRAKNVIILQFESTNLSRYPVEEVLINGEEYLVTNNGTTYTVEVPITSTEKTTLKLEEATLKNLKDFDGLNESVVVFKDAPTVTNIEANVSDEKNSITTSFEVTDEDDALTKIYVQLKDENGKVIETKELDKNARSVTFEATNEVYQAGKYSIDILADYNTLDGLSHEKVTLANKENITVDIVANIVKHTNASYYIQKETEANIFYTIEDNTDLNVTKLIINEKEYNAEKQADGTYKIIYKVPNTSGEQTLNVTGICYQNQTAETSYTSKIEVLKSEPVITHIMVDDTNEKPVLSFVLQDEEDAFVSGKIIIIDEKNQKQEIEFNKDNTSIELENIAQHTIYDVQIEVTYDLDTDRNNNQHQKTEVLKEHNFEILKDYDFTLNNLVVKEVNREGHIIVLQFESTNLSRYPVEEVLINGEEYPVTKSGTTYTVEVPITSTEKTTLTLEEATLKNLKDFGELNESVVVFKDAPTATVTYTNAPDEKNTITAKFDVTDEDSVVTKLYAELQNAKGDIVETKELDKTAREVTFKTSEGTIYQAGDYTVVIAASYDAVDGIKHEKEDLAEKGDITIGIEASIKSATPSTYYPKKGKDIEVSYTVEDNTDIDVTNIVINGQSYETTKESEDTYKITYTAPKDYGMSDLKVTQISYDNTDIEVTEYISQIDVLKTVPSVRHYTSESHYEATEKYPEKSVTIRFKLLDPDNAAEKDEDGNLKDAYIYVGRGAIPDTHGEVRPKIKINDPDDPNDINEITFVDIPVLTSLLANVRLSYDLDTDNLNSLLGKDENTDNGSALYRALVLVVPPSELHIENIDTYKENTKTHYFEKNEKIKYSFTSDVISGYGTASKYYPTVATIDGKKYELEKNGRTYATIESLPGYEESGVKTITLNSVTLDNDEIIDLKEKTSQIEVLKDKLSIDNYVLDTVSDVPNVTFSMNDEEDTFKSGEIIITNLSNNQKQTIPLEKGKLKYELNGLTEKVMYQIDLSITYDLDNNVLGEATENEKTEIFETKQFKIIQNYELKISNLKVINMNRQERKLDIQFESTNAGNYDVIEVKIDGSTYSAKKQEDGSYIVEGITFEDQENKILYLQEVKLENTKQLPVTDTSFKILKTKPTVDVFKTSVSANKDFITATFTLTDKEKTVTKLYATLKYATTDEVIETKELDATASTVNLEAPKAETYKVELSADYDVIDGEVHKKQPLAEEKDVKVGIRASIAGTNMSTYYPKKGGTVDIFYNIEDNTDLDVNSIVVNDKTYSNDELQKQEDGTYKISYQAPSEYGIVDLKITKISYDTEEIQVNRIDQFDVLKSPVQMVGYTAEPNYEDKSVTFKFTLMDNDNALLEGNNNLYCSYGPYADEEGNRTPKVKLGENEITFKNLVEGRLYLFTVIASYDLDTDQLNSLLGKDSNTNEGRALTRIGFVLTPPQ